MALLFFGLNVFGWGWGGLVSSDSARPGHFSLGTKGKGRRKGAEKKEYIYSNHHRGSKKTIDDFR